MGSLDMGRAWMLATSWVVVGAVAVAQEILPPPAPSASPTIDSPTVEHRSNPSLACLRIPASVITEEASRSFRHTATVDRVVLGTHSRGTAECRGEVHCELGDQPSTVELICHISGTVLSNTRGVNGPALISSTAKTTYTATKRIVFDGRQLSTQPATVDARTQLQITGIGSSQPGLRGRIIERVATRRAASSLREAETITCRLTADELRQHIDSEFSQRIASLNRKLAVRLTILDAFKGDEYALSIGCRPEYIQILLARQDECSPSVAVLPNFPLREKMVLWIPLPNTKSASADGVESAESWRLDDVKEFLPLWLVAPIASLQAKIDERTPRLDLLRHSNWIGFEFESKTAQ